ncbi:MAG TPA: phosphoribosyltransferase family protein [Vicinamibacteria bacterium]|nr:phosphoribosyltransferase family protein [Vicinamibacteria bacterium]
MLVPPSSPTPLVYGTSRALHTGVLFPNRSEAGRLLGEALQRRRTEEPVVLGLARGGIAVAVEVARVLGAPLDVWIARKISVADVPEVGLGAVAEGGEVYLDHRMLRSVGVTAWEAADATRRAAAEVERSARFFRGGAPAPDVGGRTVVLVDDGIATGGTAQAAARSLRRAGVARLVLAVPVAALRAAHELTTEVDELVCLQVPTDLVTVGRWYLDFRQMSDEEVKALLDRARGAVPAPAATVVEGGFHGDE